MRACHYCKEPLPETWISKMEDIDNTPRLACYWCQKNGFPVSVSLEEERKAEIEADKERDQLVKDIDDLKKVVEKGVDEDSGPEGEERWQDQFMELEKKEELLKTMDYNQKENERLMKELEKERGE